MERVGEFLKVSYEQFYKAMKDEFDTEMEEGLYKTIYDCIKIPTRATSGSAGYDFKAPFGVYLKPGETIKIPTGIRAIMDDGWCLVCLPRSSLGFKYRMQLNNTLGLIDGDYFYSDNEGHIFAKITNDSNEGKELSISAGDGFMQGVFLPYGITYFDNAKAVRNGGMGSTGR